MANYFRYFPVTYYLNEDEKNLDAVTQIVSRVNIFEQVKNNPSTYDVYSVNEGDTPEILADRFYDDVTKHWVILLMNDIIDPQKDWPLTDRAFIRYLNDKYAEQSGSPTSGAKWSQTQPHSFFKLIKKENLSIGSFSEETIPIDLNGFNELVPSVDQFVLSDGNIVKISTSKFIKTIYEHELDENDNKKIIKILRSQYLPIVTNQLREAFE